MHGVQEHGRCTFTRRRWAPCLTPALRPLRWALAERLGTATSRIRPPAALRQLRKGWVRKSTRVPLYWSRLRFLQRTHPAGTQCSPAHCPHPQFLPTPRPQFLAPPNPQFLAVPVPSSWLPHPQVLAPPNPQFLAPPSPVPAPPIPSSWPHRSAPPQQPSTQHHPELQRTHPLGAAVPRQCPNEDHSTQRAAAAWS